MIKFRYITLISVFVVFILLLFGFFFGTHVGFVSIKNCVNYFGRGIVSIDSVEGRLMDDFSVSEFRLTVPSIEINLARCNVSWRPTALFRGTIALESLEIKKVDIFMKEGGETTEPDENFRGVFVPLALQLDKLSVNDLALYGGDETPLLTFDTIDAGVDGNLESITFHELNIEGPEIGLELRGNLSHREVWELDLKGKWRIAGFGFHQMQGEYILSGPLTTIGVDVTLEEPGYIRVQGELQNVITDPKWQAGLTASNFDLSTWIIDCPEIKLASVTGELNGDFGSYRGEVEAVGSWDMFDNLQLSAVIDGGESGILFNKIRIDRDEGYAIGDGGSISWEDIFSWQAELLVRRFNLSVFSNEIEGVLDGDFKSVGDVLDEGVDVTFDVSRIHGSVHGVDVDLKGTLFLDENGVYTKGLILESGEFHGKALVTEASFKWDDSEAWAAELDLLEFNPAPLHAQLSGRVSGHVSANGGWSEERYSADIELLNISGELRDQILVGNGNIQLRKNVVHSKGLFISVGDTTLSVKGGVEEELNLAFEFHSPAIDSFLPGLYGTVDITGHLNGSTDTPKLSAILTAENIVRTDHSFASLEGRIEAELIEDGAIDISAEGKELTINEVEIDSFMVGAEGKVSNHRITISASSHLFDTGVYGIGGYFNKGWNGTISNFSLNSKEYGEYVQEGRALFQASEDKIALYDFCFENSIAAGCVQGEVGLSDLVDWSLTGELMEGSLDKVNSMDLLPVDLSGKVEGYLRASGNVNRVIKGQGRLVVPQAQLALDSADNSEENFHFENGSLTVDLNEESMAVTGSVQEQGGGELKWDLQVGNAGSLRPDFSTMALDGNVELSDLKFDLLGGLTHHGVQPKGLLNGMLKIGGRVNDPNMSGELSLEDGGVELPYQGITVQDIALHFGADGTGTNVKGRLISGAGSLIVDGHIDYGPSGTKGNIHMTGKDFQIVNLPEYSFNVNPDVYFSFDDTRGEISGSVVVPYGLIIPEELTNSVSVSEDVVLVGPEEDGKKGWWPFYLDLHVLLGDEVSIDGYGLSGRLGGDLAIKITPDDYITGKGELDLLDGIFTFYGRSFDIERGRVLFTGGPIDNPGVDVRAQKAVSDEEAAGKGYTVGVDIGGLIQDLDFHLFSDPYMEDTEILSHLILGHSIAGSNEEEGNLLQAAASTIGLAGSSRLIGTITGLLPIDDVHLEGSAKDENVALVVGKRITEDLYIGYDMNMFSQLGQFRVRYDLTRGFWVETRSSSESTGADLMYSFER